MKPPREGLRPSLQDGDTGSMDEMPIQRKAAPRLSAEQRETLEHIVKSLHEANTQRDPGERYTILDGLRLLSDDAFRGGVLAQVRDPYLLGWWGRDFAGWSRQYRSEAMAPVQTRLSYYASSKRARAILGQPQSTIDIRKTVAEGDVLLVSTAQATAGRDVAALVGASLLHVVDAVVREQGMRPPEERRGHADRRRRDAVDPRRGLRVDAERVGQVRGLLHPGHPEPRQARRPLPDDAGHPPRQRGVPGRLPGSGRRRAAARRGDEPRPRLRGGHRLPAGAPLLRPRHRRRVPASPPSRWRSGEPEPGDREAAARIRAHAIGYTTPTETIAARERANGRAEAFERGLDDLGEDGAPAQEKKETGQRKQRSRLRAGDVGRFHRGRQDHVASPPHRLRP